MAGVGGSWTADFEPQAVMLERWKKDADIPLNKDPMEHMGWSGREGYRKLDKALFPYSAKANKGSFTAYVGGKLGGTATFTDSGEGSIKVSASGVVS